MHLRFESRCSVGRPWNLRHWDGGPPQGINFNLLIHRIHTGENLKDAGKSYTVIGRNGSINDFAEVRFSAMSPQGTPGDTRNCANCHVNDSTPLQPASTVFSTRRDS